MKCIQCQKEIPTFSKFCNHCGAPQRKKRLRCQFHIPPDAASSGKPLPGQPPKANPQIEPPLQADPMQASPKKKPSDVPRFSQIALSWMTNHFETIEYNTKKSYKPAYTRALDRFGDMPIDEIKPSDINSFIGQFARKGFYQKTVRTQLLVLSMIFRWAVVDGVLDQNPAEYVSISKNLPKHKRDLPPDEYLDLVKENTHLPFGMLAFSLLYTGCRIGELLALQYRDIDRTEKIIHITKSIYHEGNKPVIKKPKSEAGTRDIILLDLLAEKIPEGDPEAYIFPDDSGDVMSHSYFRHGWNAYCKALGIYDEYEYTDKYGHRHTKVSPLMTPHQLRHGFATLLYEAQIDEKVAQSLLGHSSISVTKDIYTHVRKIHQKKSADLLNAYTENMLLCADV